MEKKKKKFSIYAKICVLSGVIFITSIIVILISGSIKFKVADKENFYTSSKRELKHIENGIQLFFSSTKNNLQMLIDNPLVKNADDSLHRYFTDKNDINAKDTIKSDTEKKLVKYFKEIFNAYPEYAEVYFGSIWGGYATSFDGKMSHTYDPRKRGWYKQATAAAGKMIITDSYLSTIGEIVICFSQAVYSPQKKQVGCMSIEITLTTITDMIAKSKIGETGFIMLLQKNNVILADPKHKNLKMKTLDESEIPEYQKLKIKAGEVKLHFDEEDWLAQVSPITGELNWKLIGLIKTSEISSKSNKVIIFLFSIGIILLIGNIILTLIFARSIVTPIKKTVIALKDISMGEQNLTARLPITGNDEITDLSLYFNKTLKKIADTIKSVSANTEKIKNTGDELTDNVLETNTAIQQINVNIEKVQDQVKSQNNNVKHTADAINIMLNSISIFNTSIIDQSTNINQSSSSIEEMVQSIHSVSKILEKNKKLIDDLENESRKVKESAKNTTHIMQDISSQSESLLEASSVIQNIASQTNLLAMNAAIEAAHAGDSGKGFAVVADEIRKLAEESSVQGKTITSVLKNLKTSIDNVANDSLNAEKLFIKSFDLTTEVKNQEDTIMNAMNEQNSGSEQILKAMENISSITSTVTNTANKILENSTKAADDMDDLAMITENIANNISEMSNGIKNIKHSSESVNKITQITKNSIHDLANEVNQFKV